MKKAWLFLFIGLTVFLAGLTAGIFIGQHIHGSNVTLEFTPQASVADSAASSAVEAPEYLVDINTASVDLLDTLPGIGPALAQRIVDYREANGPYAAKEDLLQVTGIGNEKLKAIYDLIIVEVNNENTGS